MQSEHRCWYQTLVFNTGATAMGTGCGVLRLVQVSVLTAT